MLSFARRTALAAVDIVLPFRCAACGEIVDGTPGFCPDCWKKLSFITRPHCTQCSEPFDLPVPDNTRCGACLATPPPWSAARAVWRYEGSARDPILRLKYGDRTDLVTLFARHLAQKMESLAVDKPLLIPVPLHRWRLFTRTFNQSALLATALGRLTQQPVQVDGLRRVKNTRPQQGLSRMDRKTNVRAAFQVTDPARVRGRTIILIDDVITTGATVESCARQLLRHGASDIKVLTLARVVNLPRNPI
jgi:ComF family protein